MGLAPSRQQYTGAPAGNGQDTAAQRQGELNKDLASTAASEALLPFISRAPDGYTYQDETAAGVADEDAAADAPAPKPAAKKAGKGRPTDAEDANEIVYYYEHRLVPLTSDFFPSESSVLFEQLYAARAAQNARYHFQTTETWSPGCLLDPTAHYQSLEALADVACDELAQLLRKPSTDAADTDGGEEKKNKKTAHKHSRKDAAASPSSLPADEDDAYVPFASREMLYDLFVRLFEVNGMLYSDDKALREAWMATLPAKSIPVKGKDKATDATRGGTRGASSQAAPGMTPPASTPSARTLRPLPCAIALVRVPVTKAAYREIYYKAGFQRHHHMSKAHAAGGSEAAASVMKKMAQALESLKVIQITSQDVMRAVRAHDDRQASRRGDTHQRTRHTGAARDAHTQAGGVSDDANKAAGRQWLTVAAPHESMERPVELRIVGMFGCWTVEELLRYSLFVRSPESGVDGRGTPPRPYSLMTLPASAQAILARARPHDVPSSTLLKITFFEKQVGDKEQCHTYFALLRYFARGLRDCFMAEASVVTRPSLAASASPSSASAGGVAASTAGATPGGKEASHKGTATTANTTATAAAGAPSEPSKKMARILPLVDDPDSAWGQFIQSLVAAAERTNVRSGTDAHAVTASTTMATPLPDWSTALLVRFSNVPQLQLCRQIRLLVHELVELYPEPPTLVALQDAQRSRGAALTGMKPSAAAGATSNTVAAAEEAADSGATSKTAKAKKPEPLHTVLTEADSAASAARESLTPEQLLACVPRKKASAAAGISGGTAATPNVAAPHLASGNHRMGGLACYIQDGLVVMRLSHLQAVRAIQQLARMPLEDSVEALAVTLTAPAPPQLTYRGELRVPTPHRLAGVSRWQRRAHAPLSPTGSFSAASPASLRPDGVADGKAWSPPPSTLRNACRFVLDGARGYPLYAPPTPAYVINNNGLSCDEDTKREAEVAAMPAARISAAALADEEIGVHPPTHAGLLSCPGWKTASALSVSTIAANDTTADGNASGHATTTTSSEPHWMNLFSPFPYACKLPEVYVVPKALDGVSFRTLLEMAQRVAEVALADSGLTGAQAAHGAASSPLARPVQGPQYQHPFLSILPCGTMTETAAAMLSGPDSVLSSPLSVPDMMSMPWITNTTAPRSPELHPFTQTSSTQSAVEGLQEAHTEALGPTIPRSWFNHVRLSEPDRVLHMGDVIRCDPSTPSSPPQAANAAKSMKPAKTQTPESDPPTPTAAAPVQMHWYVDDELRMEDIILSWMRRLGSRARETRPADYRWVRYPPSLFQKLLWTEIRYGRPWLLFDEHSHVRFPLRSSEGLKALSLNRHAPSTSTLHEVISQDGVLISLLDIVKDRRFRQWEFALNGFTYFHGVSVRLPGIVALPLEGDANAAPTTEDNVGAAPRGETKSDAQATGKKIKCNDTTTTATRTTTTSKAAGPADAPVGTVPLPTSRVDPNTTALRLFHLRDGSVGAVAVDDWMHENMRPGEVDPPIPGAVPAFAVFPKPSASQTRAPRRSMDLHRPPLLNATTISARVAPAPVPSPPVRPLARCDGAVSTQSNSGSHTHTPMYRSYPHPSPESSPNGAAVGSGALPLSSAQYPSRVPAINAGVGSTGGSPYMGYMMAGSGGPAPAQGDPAMTYGGSYYYYGGSYGEPSTSTYGPNGAYHGGSFPRKSASSYTNVEFAAPGMAMDRLDSNSFQADAATSVSSMAGLDPARVTGSFFNDAASSSYSAGVMASYGHGDGSGGSSPHSPHASGPQQGVNGASRTSPQPPPPQQPSRYPMVSQMTAMMPQVLQAPTHHLMPSTTGLRHHVWRETDVNASSGSHDGPSTLRPMHTTTPHSTGTTVKVRVMSRTRSDGSALSINAMSGTTTTTTTATSTNQGYEHRRPVLPTRVRGGRAEAMLYMESSADTDAHEIQPGPPLEAAGGSMHLTGQPSGSELAHTENSSAYGAIGLSRGGVEELPEDDSNEFGGSTGAVPGAHSWKSRGDGGGGDGAHPASNRAASRGTGLGSQKKSSWRSHNPYAYSSNNNLLSTDVQSVTSSSSLRSPATSFHNSYTNNGATNSYGQSRPNGGSMVGGSSLYGNGSGNDFTASLYRNPVDEDFAGASEGGGLYGAPWYGDGSGGSGSGSGSGPSQAYGPPLSAQAAPYKLPDQPASPAAPLFGFRPTFAHVDPQALRGSNSGPFYMTSPLPQPVSASSAHSTPRTSPIPSSSAGRGASGGQENGTGAAGGASGRQTVVTFCSTGDSAAPTFSATTPQAQPILSRGPLSASECVHNTAVVSFTDEGTSGGVGTIRIPSTVVSTSSHATSNMAQKTAKTHSHPSSMPVPAAPSKNTFLKKK